ncbi:MAG TPA: VWA-like domain-containing protein [Acidimicrobiales bacterium]|nr:VWA-like domain-containing protein [Acidimicrobiales bacterium]
MTRRGVEEGRLDRRKVAAARLWAATKFPYLSTALFATSVIERPGLGGDGVAVDAGWRLYVDPEAATGWTVPDLGALLVHHTGHLIRDHAGRAETLGVTDSTAERWSTAADAELNDDLVEVGLHMPGRVILPDDLGYERGRLAEEYYARERAEEERDPDAGDPDDASAPEPEEQAEKPRSDHGSGAHNHHRPWEDPADGADDGVAPAFTALQPHERDLLRAQTAQQLLDAVRTGQGNVPSNWRRWAEELLAPTVDWRRALGAEVRRGVQLVAGAVDYSYRRPSRRASVSPTIVLPALEKPVPEVAVVCDTSGSMGEHQLARVLGEVEGLLDGIGLRSSGVRVLAVDAAVQTVRRVASARQVELVGGGGTDMGRGIAAAAALKPRPSVLVVLTDGLTPWPAEPPRGMRVVIGLLTGTPAGRYSSLPSTPHWARVVRIDEER